MRLGFGRQADVAFEAAEAVVELRTKHAIVRL
jgi:hypothetical protein